MTVSDGLATIIVILGGISVVLLIAILAMLDAIRQDIRRDQRSIHHRLVNINEKLREEE